MAKTIDCELLVIGGGTGGLRTALYAANHGHKTVLAEPGVLGGTCLNTGCIPTKAMLHAAHLYKSTMGMKEFGIQVATPKVNFGLLMQRVHKIIQEGQSHIGRSIKKSPNLTLLKEKAAFLDKRRVKVGNTIVIPRRTIIATGAKTWIPPIKGIDKVPFITNEEVLQLKKLPKSLLIVGGGYISMEFATFFSQLGCKVTVIEFMPKILTILDDDIVEVLLKEYEKLGITFYLNRNITEANYAKGKVTVKFTDRDKPSTEKASADAILVATGRVSHSAGLDCMKGGIRIGKRGNVEVDDELKTSNPAVYAIGDVTGKAMFAHAAKRESHIALVNALDGSHERMPWGLCPWAVFTDPPVAGVGMLTKELEAQKITYGTLKAPFTRAGRATVIDDTRGFVKVYYQKGTGKILSTFIVGPRADDLIHEFAALLNSSSPTVETIRKTIHVHPTLSEVMEALKEA